MAKLFEGDLEDLIPGRITREGVEIEPSELDLEGLIGDHEDYMQVATENFSHLTRTLSNVSNMQSNLVSKQVGSREYLYTVENYHELIKSAANNMGVKVLLPAMEDYSSSFAAKGCHEVTVEGIKDTIKKIWEKIKNFFASIWKKISNFVKRITRMNMDVDMYDRYIEDYIRKIKKNDLKPSDAIKTIKTKLPAFLATRDTADYRMESVLEDFSGISGNVKHTLDRNLKNAQQSISGTINAQLAAIKGIQLGVDGTEVTQKLASISDSIGKAIETFNVSNNDLVERLTSLSMEFNKAPMAVKDLFDSVDSEGVFTNLFTLVDDEVKEHRLPKGYNIYIATIVKHITEAEDPELKNVAMRHVSVAKSTYDTSSINNELAPISNIYILEDLYSKYKEFRKTISGLNDITSKFNSSFKDIDNLIVACNKAYNDIDKVIMDLKASVEASNDEMTIEWTRSSFEEAVTLLKGFNSFNIRNLDSYKDCIRTFSTEMYSTCTELRYEMARYLYESCRNFR